MKCVLNKKEKIIERVQDDKADSLVKAGTHSYASKQEWKRSRQKETHVKS